MLRAILGGSFDPVHLGHLAMAAHILENDLADRLLVVPAWRSPHKFEDSATPSDRLAMVELAFAGMDGTEVDDREITRGRVSYTVETLEDLAVDFPGDRLRLVIGADNLTGFAGWREPGRIQELAEIVVFPRDGVDPDAESIRRSGLDPGRVIPVNDFDHPVSSSAVRAILARGIMPVDQLPPAVADFITAQNIYQP
ncbi:MAG: nicotinate (nicotinamide) nucleotide adenylyltransferase [Candidatus Krumholzibacteriota bacterium]